MMGTWKEENAPKAGYGGSRRARRADRVKRMAKRDMFIRAMLAEIRALKEECERWKARAIAAALHIEGTDLLRRGQ